MKQILSIVLGSLLLFSSCGETAKEQGKEKANSEIDFESTTFDFGTIAYGSDGVCTFKFTNTSKEPLIVNVVRTTCGCTNPDWPKDPIEKGGTGEIKVTYNTEIPGKFKKTITVFCNSANSPVKLAIMGEVQHDNINSSSSKQ